MIDWLLVGGPAHGRVVKRPEGQAHILVIAKVTLGKMPMLVTYTTQDYAMNGKLYRLGMLHPTQDQMEEVPALLGGVTPFADHTPGEAQS